MAQYDPNDFVVDEEEWKSAGLWDRGSYKFKVLSMEPNKRNTDEGKSYPVITGRLQAVAVAEYDGAGNFQSIRELGEDDRKPTRFQDFPVRGSGLQMIKTLYKTMTGRYPEGVLDETTGRFKFDTLTTAKELVGHEAWNVVYWTKPSEKEKDLGSVYDRITFTFTDKPRAKMKIEKTEAPKEEEETDE